MSYTIKNGQVVPKTHTPTPQASNDQNTRANIHSASSTTRRTPISGVLAGWLGVEGKTITIPQIASKAPVQVPVIYCIILLLLTIFFGLKALVIALLFYVLAPSANSSTSRNQRASS